GPRGEPPHGGGFTGLEQTVADDRGGRRGPPFSEGEPRYVKPYRRPAPGMRMPAMTVEGRMPPPLSPPPLFSVEESSPPFTNDPGDWKPYAPTPTWTDPEKPGQEYVNLWHQEEAFGLRGPRSLALEHWWIETPSKEFGIGPLGQSYGTDQPP